jgi:predicted nucleic acid-binding protein
MLLLDTNVVSELMRATPEAKVLAWVDEQPASSLFLSAISQAEVLYGIALLPEGRRKQGTAEAADLAFTRYFFGRILPFDSAAAGAYAAIALERRAIGRPIAQFDAQIAAIARSRGATLATRNTGDFEDCGIDVIDPWTTSL